MSDERDLRPDRGRVLLFCFFCAALLACEPLPYHQVSQPEPANDRDICIAPSAPQGLQVTVHEDRIELSWQVGTGTTDGYIIERRLFLDPTWGELEPLDGADQTQFVDASNIMLDAQYGYRVRAFRRGRFETCRSAPTEEAIATTLPRAPQEPTIQAYADRIEIHWRDPNDFETGYLIERRRQQVDRTFQQMVQLDRNDVSWIDTDLVAGTVHDYKIYAVNRSGRSQAVLVSAPVRITTRVPLPPTLSWQGDPTLDNQCVLHMDASAVVDSELGAVYDPQRSSLRIDGLSEVRATEHPEGSGQFSMRGQVDPVFTGQALASWEVWDSLDGHSRIDRTLRMGQVRSSRVRSRLPQLVLSDDDMQGRQVLLPGCSTCTGPRGSISAGYAHACTVTADGGARCWGLNNRGQLGNGVAPWKVNFSRVCSGMQGQPCAEVLGNVDDFTLGSDVTCATTSGQARCWGDNAYGQLGVGPGGRESYGVPTSVCTGGAVEDNTCVPLQDVVSIDTRDNRACAVTGDGQVWCWGQRDRLGIGDDDDRYNATKVCDGDPLAPCVNQLFDVVEVGGGSDFTCARMANSSVRCWGANRDGQLGLGHKLEADLPSMVCASGRADQRSCSPLTGVTHLAVGSSHACAILRSGLLVCWGDSWYGQLGTGDEADHPNPGIVCASGSEATEDCVPLVDVLDLAAGSDHTCAVNADHEVLCWGYSGDGRLGTGQTSSSPTPSKVCVDGVWNGSACVDEWLASYDVLGGVARVFAGSKHTCAVMQDGTAQCWGDNYDGQLGDGSYSDHIHPSPVCATGAGPDGDCVALDQIEQLALGDDVTCALRTGGDVWCWGDNYYGQLGDGDAGYYNYSANPVQVCASGTGSSCDPLVDAVEIVAKSSRACVLRSDNQVVCWGSNSSGRLGDGSNDSAENPVPVCTAGVAGTDCTALTGVQAIGMGSYHSCAAGQSGSLFCWGDSDSRKLGVTLGRQAVNAVRVCAQGAGVDCQPLEHGLQVVSGVDHVCAVVDEGGARQARCWGNGYYGALGQGVDDTTYNPVMVCESGTWDGSVCAGGQPLEGIQELGAGDDFTCALMDNQQVLCWGYGNYLGDHAGYSTNQPVSVCDGESAAGPCEALTGVRDIAVGDRHACAVVGGGVKCWGSRYNGRLGDGTQDSSSRDGAVDVCLTGLWNGTSCTGVTLAGVQTVAAGTGHTCALLASGRVMCWGKNSYGQLGDGGVEDRKNPAFVCESGSVEGGDCVPLEQVSAIGAGEYHTCALHRTSGGGEELLCWGSGDTGQLGAGSGAQSPYPSDVCLSGVGSDCQRLRGVVALATGVVHTCALLESGRVRCWGSGGLGQLGTGPTLGRSEVPLEVCARGGQAEGDCDPLENVVAIAARGWNTCAVLADGTARCWGDNQFGQVGNGIVAVDGRGIADPVVHPAPVCLAGRGPTCQPLQDIVSVALGESHACAILADGSMQCWGRNGEGQLGDGTRQESGCDDYYYDRNGHLQLVPTTCRFAPVDVCESGAGPGCRPLSGVQSMSLGLKHSCALLLDGSVRCWGDNSSAQLGDGTTVGAHLPQQVMLQQDNAVVALSGVIGLAASNTATCALLQSGAVQCWGENYWGQLGDATRDGEPCLDAYGYDSYCRSSPVDVCDQGLTLGSGCGACAAPLHDAVAITGGDSSFCTLNSQGQPRCWGLNWDGQLGNGNSGWRVHACQASAVCAYRDGLDCVAVDASATASCSLMTVDVAN